jgi:rubrerythrin
LKTRQLSSWKGVAGQSRLDLCNDIVENPGCKRGCFRSNDEIQVDEKWHCYRSAQNQKQRKEISMKFESLEAIVDFAIEKEIEAAEFYSGLSKDESLSGSGQMFKEFSAEERKHQRMLEEFKTKGITEAISDYQFKWITDIKRSDYVVDLEYEKGMPYNEILMLAMKREEKALKLYNAFLEQADTEEGKKIFKILCQEEAKHKLALETMYDDYMAQMGD